MSTLLKSSPVTSTRSSSQGKILVFIDRAVEAPQFLADGIIPEATAFILNPSQDGIKQITEILQDYPQVESLHLVSHGSPGSIQLGNTYLSLDTLAEYQQDLKHWSSSSLLIYGCNVAAGDAGAELIEKLHQLTGANIAASQTKTGNASLGGDWNLEVTTNSHQAALAFDQSVLTQYLFTFAIERVSVGENGIEGNSSSGIPSISEDGRYVSFESSASNLVPGDINNSGDIFVYDRELNTTERVSVDNSGNQENSSYYRSSISGDGRYVSFHSPVNNLVPGANIAANIFVYDRELNTTERIYVGQDATNSSFFDPSTISGDGRYVIFSSYVNNLVSGDTNGVYDIFVYDRELSTTERVSVDSNGTQGNSSSGVPSISRDGRYVTFQSYANNLVAEDTNNSGDIFVYDRELKTTERVSVGENGTQGNNSSSYPEISEDGRYVTFESPANNLVSGDTNYAYDIFVYDRELSTTERVSIGENGSQSSGNSLSSSISTDGRYVTFSSFANNLVPGDTNSVTDIFVYDRKLKTTERVSVDSNGIQVNEGSWSPSISGDGRYITFSSSASNLVPGDTNGSGDVFVVENPFLTNPPVVETEIPNQIANNTDIFSLDVSSNFQDADDSGKLSFSSTGLPAGLSISPEGMISGQTQANGSYTVEITAEDLSASARDYFQLTVYESMTGTDTDDRLIGDSKFNEIKSLAGNDRISGFGGSDRLFGGDGSDVLRGGTQSDQLFGEAGSDRLFGGYGDDLLKGGTENDRLFGENGDDQLMGGKGDDELVGDEGADIFVLQSHHGLDTISDFNLNKDRLVLSTNFTGSLGLSESDGNTTISIVGEEGEKAIAILQGVTGVDLVSLGFGIK